MKNNTMRARMERVREETEGKLPKNMVEEFYQENVNLLHEMVKSYRNVGEYKDLIQEASIGMLAGTERWKSTGGASMTTFSWYCAENKIREVRRKNAAKSRHSDKPLVNIDGPVEIKGRVFESIGDADITPYNQFRIRFTSPEEYAETRENVEKIMELLSSSCSPDEVAAFNSILRNETQNKIAKDLGCSQAHISKLLSSVRKKMFQALSENGFELGEYVKNSPDLL